MYGWIRMSSGDSHLAMWESILLSPFSPPYLAHYFSPCLLSWNLSGVLFPFLKRTPFELQWSIWYVSIALNLIGGQVQFFYFISWDLPSQYKLANASDMGHMKWHLSALSWPHQTSIFTAYQNYFKSFLKSLEKTKELNNLTITMLSSSEEFLSVHLYEITTWGSAQSHPKRVNGAGHLERANKSACSYQPDWTHSFNSQYVKFSMTAFQSKPMRHMKKQESMNHMKRIFIKRERTGTYVRISRGHWNVLMTAFHMFLKLSRDMKAIKKIQTKLL